MCRLRIAAAIAAILISSSATASILKTFRADAVEPGKTTRAQLNKLLGRPVRVARDGMSHEFYFYDLGEGSTMDATVSIRHGVVEYITYLCDDSMKDIRHRYHDEPSTIRTIRRSASGYSETLKQVLYQEQGRGYLYEPGTMKVKACVAWQPGTKFSDLGR